MTPEKVEMAPAPGSATHLTCWSRLRAYGDTSTRHCSPLSHCDNIGLVVELYAMKCFFLREVRQGSEQ